MARETRSKSIQKARKTTAKRRTKSQSQIALEKEYKRLRKNLQQQQRYYRQRGMLVYEDVIPSIPKKITPSSIKRLQNIDVRKRALKGERIQLEKGERFDPTTGEIIGAKIDSSAPTPKLHFYPTVSVIDTIRQRITELELQTRGYDPNFENMKNTLLNIFEENVAYHEDNLDELIDYYNNNLFEILSELDKLVMYRNKQDEREREQSFAVLARLLNGGSLSRLQAEAVSNFGEYFSM